jgi:D-alanyl-D-alanine carboxypeptidase
LLLFINLLQGRRSMNRGTAFEISIRLSVLFMALLCLVAPTLGSGAGEETGIISETAVGRMAADWLRAFNSGDPDVMDRFQVEHDSEALLAKRDTEQRRNMYVNVHAHTGSITPVRILQEESDHICILARSENGIWLEIDLRFEPESGKIAGLRLRPSVPPGDLPSEDSMSESEAMDGIREKLEELTGGGEFSGTVLIAREGEPVFIEAFGLASREFSVPNRVDTKYNLGSINKIFTKTAVALLLSEGGLSLDDRLGDHLPDYPNREAAEKVTVRHLIEMTSGIGDFFGERFMEIPKSQLRTLEDYLPLFADEPLEFEPGTSNRYSNGGYVVLGLVVQHAAGENYFDYVRGHIFEPAGMKDTDSYEADEIVENLACGYTRFDFDGEEREPCRNIYTRPARGSSAGGGYSTVQDLLRFVGAMESGALLAPEYGVWVFGGPEPTDRDARRTDSTEEASGDGLPAIVIGGGAPGINAFLENKAAGRYTVIVLTNLDPPVAMETGSLIRGWLEGIE